ncbi:MAG: sulfurtransferase, partial [Deltaproteobacteria bacterium]
RFSARLDPSRVRDLAAIQANLGGGPEQVVDTRAAERFEGRQPEPRPGVRSGHIPGSLNLPFTDLVAADGTFLPPERLRARIKAAGLDPRRPVIAACGSGTSACSLVLALALLGHEGAAVYDGSWTEWGGRTDTPVEVGPARAGA